MRQPRHKRAVGRQMAGLYMILHIVHVAVRDDNVGACIANHIGHGIDLRLIMPVDLHIRDVDIEYFLRANVQPGVFRLFGAKLAQRTGLDDDVPLIAICHMAHIDVRALLNILP